AHQRPPPFPTRRSSDLIAADSGDGASAIAILEKVPDLDSRPDALKALLRSHILLGHNAQAEPVAAKLLSVHNDLCGIKTYAESRSEELTSELQSRSDLV